MVEGPAWLAFKDNTLTGDPPPNAPDSGESIVVLKVTNSSDQCREQRFKLTVGR